MRTTRTLVLRRDTLGDLSGDELRLVEAGMTVPGLDAHTVDTDCCTCQVSLNPRCTSQGPWPCIL